MSGVVFTIIGIVFLSLGMLLTTVKDEPHNKYKVVVFDEEGEAILTANLPFPKEMPSVTVDRKENPPAAPEEPKP